MFLCVSHATPLKFPSDSPALGVVSAFFCSGISELNIYLSQRGCCSQTSLAKTALITTFSSTDLRRNTLQ